MIQFLVRQGHWNYNKPAKAQSRAKSRRNNATKAQIHEESRKKATQSHEGTKPCGKDAKKTTNKAAQAKQTAQKGRVPRNRANRANRDEGSG